jgi:hypothetical protein
MFDKRGSKLLFFFWLAPGLVAEGGCVDASYGSTLSLHP